MKKRVGYLLLVGTGLVCTVGSIILDPGVGFPWSIAGVVIFVVGAILAWRVPTNPISWLLLVTGVGLAGPALLRAVALEVADPATAAWMDAVSYAFSTASVLLLPIVLLRFPDGRAPSQPWRYIEWLAGAAAFFGFLAALFNGGWGGDQTQALAPSPLFEQTTPVGDVFSAIFYPSFLLAFVGASISLIVRYRRSTGEARLQFKWLAYAAGFLLAGLIAILIDSGFAAVSTDKLWEATLMSLAFAAIPASIGVAVLKYRLYEVDVVISRTVVLAVLAVFITITYVLIVVGLGQLIGGDSNSLLLQIAATALVAVAFEPVRFMAQRWANRLVYGKRATPYEVLSDLTERLSGSEEGEGTLTRMATLLRDGTGADRATVWLGEPGEMTVAATSPSDVSVSEEPDMDGETGFSVIHDADVVGALEVVKPPGSLLSTTERSLVADLAGSAGAVLGYQRLNVSLAERARDLEESRARLVGVQDQERKRLERDLHEGAEQYIVALKVKVGVASQMAGKHDAPELAKLLGGLTLEAQAALDDVQSLAKGIYPPILESDGLGAAVSALASSAPVEVSVERDGVDRYPAEVEAAVYFDISEAVTNAVKHAEPPIHINLSDRNGLLVFSVADGGPGFDIDESDMGSGLENMADRINAVGGTLTVHSATGESTRVSGEIPIV